MQIPIGILLLLCAFSVSAKESKEQKEELTVEEEL